jgi:hypothetical protein
LSSPFFGVEKVERKRSSFLPTFPLRNLVTGCCRRCCFLLLLSTPCNVGQESLSTAVLLSHSTFCSFSFNTPSTASVPSKTVEVPLTALPQASGGSPHQPHLSPYVPLESPQKMSNTCPALPKGLPRPSRKPRWTPHHEMRLVVLVNELGTGKWAEVQSRLKGEGFGRTKGAVETHWTLLKSRADAQGGV